MSFNLHYCIMSSFDCASIRCNISSNCQSTTRKCRYPSYLMRVAPPRVYSSVDLRNMLVPKTYELRKVCSSFVNHNHSHRNFDDVVSTNTDGKFKDAESTKKTDDQIKIIVNNNDTIFHREDANEVVVCKIDDSSLDQKNLDKNDHEIINTKLGNGLIDENKRVGDQISECEQKLEKSIRISKVEVIDETIKNYNCINNPTNSWHVFNENHSTLTPENFKSKKYIQLEDEQYENDVFYDYDDEEQNIDYVNKQPFVTEDVYEVKLIKICKKCHKVCSFDDSFTWENVPKPDKMKFMELIKQSLK